MKKIIVTIDGPAASGKEKISKYISKKWKLKHLDSGILYRRLALIFINDKVELFVDDFHLEDLGTATLKTQKWVQLP